MELHWKSGYEDMVKTLSHPQVLERPRNKKGIGIFDFSREESIAQKQDPKIPVMKKTASGS